MVVPEFDIPKATSMKRNPMVLVVAAVLAVAFLCTMLVKDGWMVWVPVMLALAVVGYLAREVRR